MRLKDRNKQIPGGMFFYQPETRWKSSDWASFSSIVDQVIAHRNGNPHLLDKLGWQTERNAVENEVDAFIANVCATMGWQNFYVGGEGAAPEPPKSKPPSQQELSQLSAVAAKTRMIFAGVKTLNAWLDSGEPAVEKSQSESRAKVCVACPLNGDGDLTKWFTMPAATAIRKQLEKVQERKLTTSVDAKLGICSGCLCPMRLKVHTPMKFIKPQVNDQMIDALRKGKDCWVLKEL